MTAYYNEIDPYAAEWLRNLVAKGLIAPGDVDERDVRDVTPDEIKGYTQCHFFAGIGVWSHALRSAGWPDTRPVWTGSCPCQPFSSAGKGDGFADERHVWPDWHHLIAECRPAVVFGEQVASKDGLAWFDLVSSDMEGTGYAIGAADLCAAGVGAPHIRQRLWFVGERLADRSGNGRAAWRTWDHRRDDRPKLVATEPDGGVDHLCRARSQGQSGHGDQELSWAPSPRSVAATSRPCCLANTKSFRQFGRRGTNGTGGSQTSDDCQSSRLEHTHQFDAATRWPKRSRKLSRSGGDQVTGPADGSACATNGFWRAVDWIFCRDGKWRPVEPGTFPLAHGAPSRVGRLRAYGNAIVAEAAQAFIEAYGDVTNG